MEPVHGAPPHLHGHSGNFFSSAVTIVAVKIAVQISIEEGKYRQEIFEVEPGTDKGNKPALASAVEVEKSITPSS